MRAKRWCQSRIEGGRSPIHGGLEPRAEAWIRKMQIRFPGATRSLILSNAVAFTAGFDLVKADTLVRTSGPALRLAASR